MRRTNDIVLQGASDANQNGIQLDANQIISASFQAVFTNGDEVGTFKLQASNDVCPQGNQSVNFVVTNWTDIPGSLVTITAGSSALITLSSAATPYRWLRAVWVRASGGSASGTSATVSMLSQSV